MKYKYFSKNLIYYHGEGHDDNFDMYLYKDTFSHYVLIYGIVLTINKLALKRTYDFDPNY